MKPKPSVTANWIDAIIAAGVDPGDFPEEVHELCKYVFGFGGECVKCEYEDDK